MRRANRLFELIQILRRSRSSVTANQLAERLEVTPRTIYRDVASLMAMRVPIEGAAGVGYIMRPGYDLPPLMFDREEIEAIVVGLNLLHRTGDKGLQVAAQRVTAKVAEVLPDPIDSDLDDGRFVVSRFGAAAPQGVAMSLLRGAIRNDVCLRLTYRDEAGRETERTVLPLAVIYYTEATVLAAWCELRQDFRHFRADRIVACDDIGDSFRDRARDLRQNWRSRHHMPHDELR